MKYFKSRDSQVDGNGLSMTDLIPFFTKKIMPENVLIHLSENTGSLDVVRLYFDEDRNRVVNKIWMHSIHPPFIQKIYDKWG